MDRKQFFKEAYNLAVGAGIELIEKTEIGKQLLKEPQKVERPPGAGKDFLQKCTGCDLCMAACPVNVIMIEDLERRDPVIFPEKDPCIKCPGYPCIRACPVNALSRENLC